MKQETDTFFKRKPVLDEKRSPGLFSTKKVNVLLKTLFLKNYKSNKNKVIVYSEKFYMLALFLLGLKPVTQL
ncbi:MAG TPA: hypothetical protein ENN03_12220 [bacterium]|nr:hypothetical protein [bacterium]